MLTLSKFKFLWLLSMQIPVWTLSKLSTFKGFSKCASDLNSYPRKYDQNNLWELIFYTDLCSALSSTSETGISKTDNWRNWKMFLRNFLLTSHLEDSSFSLHEVIILEILENKPNFWHNIMLILNHVINLRIQYSMKHKDIKALNLDFTK